MKKHMGLFFLLISSLPLHAGRGDFDRRQTAEDIPAGDYVRFMGPTRVALPSRLNTRENNNCWDQFEKILNGLQYYVDQDGRPVLNDLQSQHLALNFICSLAGCEEEEKRLTARAIIIYIVGLNLNPQSTKNICDAMTAITHYGKPTQFKYVQTEVDEIVGSVERIMMIIGPK